MRFTLEGTTEIHVHVLANATHLASLGLIICVWGSTSFNLQCIKKNNNNNKECCTSGTPNFLVETRQNLNLQGPLHCMNT